MTHGQQYLDALVASVVYVLDPVSPIVNIFQRLFEIRLHIQSVFPSQGFETSSKALHGKFGPD